MKKQMILILSTVMMFFGCSTNQTADKLGQTEQRVPAQTGDIGSANVTKPCLFAETISTAKTIEERRKNIASMSSEIVKEANEILFMSPAADESIYVFRCDLNQIKASFVKKAECFMEGIDKAYTTDITKVVSFEGFETFDKRVKRARDYRYSSSWQKMVLFTTPLKNHDGTICHDDDFKAWTKNQTLHKAYNLSIIFSQ